VRLSERRGANAIVWGIGASGDRGCGGDVAQAAMRLGGRAADERRAVAGGPRTAWLAWIPERTADDGKRTVTKTVRLPDTLAPR